MSGLSNGTDMTTDFLNSVRNDRIEFATARPPRSQFATLERRVVVTGPPELVELAHSGDPRLLDRLVEFLKQPDRAWAAAVVLAALTGREAKMIDTFVSHPEGWWSSVGQTAHTRWSEWLREARPLLEWDSEESMFVERETGDAD